MFELKFIMVQPGVVQTIGLLFGGGDDILLSARDCEMRSDRVRDGCMRAQRTERAKLAHNALMLAAYRVLQARQFLADALRVVSEPLRVRSSLLREEADERRVLVDRRRAGQVGHEQRRRRAWRPRDMLPERVGRACKACT
jgi:hypothetical protein